MLSDRDRDFLDWLRDGGTQVEYAREHGLSRDWAKWKSRSIREKLGVVTIDEAVQMTDENKDGVSRAEFDKLMSSFDELQDALEELRHVAANGTGAQTHTASSNVQERRLSLKDLAQALGLSVKDVERLREEKDYGRFKAFQERLAAEQAAAAPPAGEEDDEDDDGGGGLLDQVRDGLGGIRNVRRQA